VDTVAEETKVSAMAEGNNEMKAFSTRSSCICSIVG